MASFDGMYKHVGQLANTGKNIVVVFMQIPDDPEFALVIDTDALPDSYNESLRRVVESDEGQQSKNLADILNRRITPDGSNLTMLQKFHEARRLHKTPIDNVIMTPRRGVNWPLRHILEAVSTAKANTPPEFDDLTPEERAIIAAENKKFNMHASNITSDDAEGNKSMALNLLEMARMLETDAIGKREQAYRLDPSLMPKTKKQPLEVLPVETVAPIVTTVSKAPVKKPAGKKTT